MEVLVFDLIGRFAHFRKIYTNSSSLSYSVPPRTALTGIVASMLGYERDSYYDSFNKEHIFIAVKKMTRTRKIIQTVNYVLATSARELTLPQKHTQIPIEMITWEPEIRYRIYFAASNTDVYLHLKERLIRKKFVFPPYLGTASFNASVNFIAEASGNIASTDNVLPINTPVDITRVAEFNINLCTENCMLVKERMPVDFTAERHPIGVSNYVFDENLGPLTFIIKPGYDVWKLRYTEGSDEITENIMFY